jgi:cell wall-associated NlpC family hydrolase
MNCSCKSMFRPLLWAAGVALLISCASNPEPMRTGISENPRYQPPDPTQPVVNPSNPVIVGDSVWQSEATKWIGAPYKAGGSSREGMDTIGLIRRMYENVARIHITPELDELSRTGNAIPRDQLRPGDIVFFGAPQITGAGIYLGENRFVQAAPTFGVTYAQLKDPQFSENYRTARRLLR